MEWGCSGGTVGPYHVKRAPVWLSQVQRIHGCPTSVSRAVGMLTCLCGCCLQARLERFAKEKK